VVAVRRGLICVAAIAAVIVLMFMLSGGSRGSGGTTAEQKLHEVCVGLSANKAKAETLVDQAQAAALQDAKLTTFSQALTAWANGSMTAAQNNTIRKTCRNEMGAPS
jgi:hypothetical protein